VKGTKSHAAAGSIREHGSPMASPPPIPNVDLRHGHFPLLPMLPLLSRGEVPTAAVKHLVFPHLLSTRLAYTILVNLARRTRMGNADPLFGSFLETTTDSEMAMVLAYAMCHRFKIKLTRCSCCTPRAVTSKLGPELRRRVERVESKHC